VAREARVVVFNSRGRWMEEVVRVGREEDDLERKKVNMVGHGLCFRSLLSENRTTTANKIEMCAVP
jgi:hypothetical protein